MPFIRYRTEDLAVYGGTHEGVVHLKRLEGRAQNWVLRSDGARIPLKSIPLGHDLKALKNVDVWQITQDQPGVVKVLVVPLPDFSSDDEREIVKKFKDFASITAVVTPVDSIPLTMSGKRRLLLQNIS
jgi:phenylacetate-CoA ligase